MPPAAAITATSTSVHEIEPKTSGQPSHIKHDSDSQHSHQLPHADPRQQPEHDGEDEIRTGRAPYSPR